MRRHLACVGAAVLALAACGEASSGERSVSLPETPRDQMVHNPGKGWVAYNDRRDYGDRPEDKATIAAADTAYDRFFWSDLVTRDANGKVRLTPERLDYWMDGWLQGNSRMRVAFGVLAESSVECYPARPGTPPSRPIVPAYVYEEGARSVPLRLTDCDPGPDGQRYVRRSPVWTDPIYLREYRRMMRLVREHLERRGLLNRVAFVDIRSYGNYGEGQTYGLNPRSCTGEEPDRRYVDLGGDCVITAAQFRRHIESARAGWGRGGPQLVMPFGSQLTHERTPDGAPSVPRAMVAEGIGLRRDGILGGRSSDSTEPEGSSPSKCPCTQNPLGSDLAIARGRTPAVFEYFNRSVWNLPRFEQALRRGSPTYVELGTPDSPIVRDILRQDPPDTIARLQRRIGYDINLTRATIPERIRAGRTIRIPTVWTNRGVSRPFVPMRLRFALLDSSGRARATGVASGTNPTRWGSGTTRATVSVRLRDAPAGEYQLAVGLDDPSRRMAYRLATTRAPARGGWYALGDVRVE